MKPIEVHMGTEAKPSMTAYHEDEESEEFAKVRAIVREEVENALGVVLERIEAMAAQGLPAKLDVSPLNVAETLLAAEVLAVFHKAADPDQCQALKYLCKTTGGASEYVLAALDGLERAGKIYSRPYFRTKLWYLVGHGPGPIKERAK
jgi:hypothetical protein